MLPDKGPTFESVHAAVAGRWADILAGLGIDPGALRNRHGPCPGCGGTDRFRFDDRDRGRFYCGGGGEPVSGDGFQLLQHVHGWTAREALQRVAEACGMDGADPLPIAPRKASAAVKVRSRFTHYARRLWRSADVEDAAVGAHPYAIKKGIDWAAGAGRAVATGTWSEIGQDADCIVIPIRTVADERLVAVQCINADGAKQSFGSMGDDGCLLLGNTLDKSIPWYVAEGWATAVSLVFHYAKGNAVCAVAFGIRRLEKVERAVIEHYHPDEITIVDDAT
jgi:phage/plasmid primase-like uncharacterized protein